MDTQLQDDVKKRGLPGEPGNKWGGPKPGAGRKPKMTELELAECLDAYMHPEEAARRLYEAVQDPKTQPWALQLWFKYRFSEPPRRGEVDTRSIGIVVTADTILAARALIDKMQSDTADET